MIDDRGVYPRPIQDPLPVWIAVGGTPEFAARAGFLGLPLALAIIGGDPARFAPFAEIYRAAATEAGHARPAFSINSHGLIADDSQTAVELAFPPMKQMMDRIGRERGWGVGPMTIEQFEHSRRLKGANFVGSPSEIVDKILYQWEIFNHDRFLIQFTVGTLPHSVVMHSIELIWDKCRAAGARRADTSAVGDFRSREMTEDLRQLANEHWRGFYRGLVDSLGGEWRRFGNVDAFSTPHVPAAFANGVLAIEPATAKDVISATTWSRESGAPFRVRIDTALGADVLDAPLGVGLERDDWTMPGMVLMPVPVAPEPPPGVITERSLRPTSPISSRPRSIAGCRAQWPSSRSISPPRALAISTSFWADWTGDRQQPRRSFGRTTWPASMQSRRSRTRSATASVRP